MKNLLVILAIAAFTLNSCKKDDDSSPATDPLKVEQKNKAAVLYFGEDWCPPCGSAGGPTLDSALAQEGSLLVGIKVNSGSDNSQLDWAPGDQMFWDFNSGVFNPSNPSSGGIPAMAVNNTKQSISSNVSSNYAGVVSKANSFALDSVIAGVALTKSIVGDSVKVSTRVKFFKEQSVGNQYNIAVYLVEDDVISNQTGASASYRHRNQVRSCNANTYTGVSLNNGDAISNGQEYNNTFTLPKRSLTGNNGNFKAVAII